MESLSPKEIQARIRMGANPEDLAEEAGWPLEKIQRFAAPLLAERAFIATAAQDAPLRTSAGETTLGEAVQAVCFSARLPMHALEWDSWRRPDGRWVVTVSFPVGASQVRGSWAFDPRVKSLHDLDEAARWLLGESEVSLDELARHQTLTLPLPRMRERPLEAWEADRAEADRWRRQPVEMSRSVAGDDDADINEVEESQNLPDDDAPTPTAIARAA
ncbi:MAG: septation protein SepH, partial [Actinomycetales bacterium]